MIGEINL